MAGKERLRPKTRGGRMRVARRGKKIKTDTEGGREKGREPRD